MLLAARENSIADLRYEDFTDDVNEIARKLGTAIPQLRNISPNARVKVKDYDEQEVTNMNEEQIGALTPEQVAAISCVLATDATVVEQLGYSIR